MATDPVELHAVVKHEHDVIDELALARVLVGEDVGRQLAFDF